MSSASGSTTTCDVVLIVRTAAARLALLNALTDRGQLSVENEVQLEGSKMSCFRNRDKRKVGIIVSAAADPRARMLKMCGVAAKTKCSSLGLIDAGYDVEFLQRRRAELPSRCGVMFVDDLEMLMDLLGYDHIQAIQREILKPIFTAGADTDLPNPLPPVSATARPKETVITVEDYGEPSDGDEDGSIRVSGGGSTVQAGPGSVVMSNVSMDGATFRALMDIAAQQRPGSSPFQVVPMPATPEEHRALNRSGSGSGSGPQRVRKPSLVEVDRKLNRSVPGHSRGRGTSIMVNDMAPKRRIERTVPSPAVVRLPSPSPRRYPPLVPTRRAPPPAPGQWADVDLMDMDEDEEPEEPEEEEEEQEDRYWDAGEEIESVARPEPPSPPEVPEVPGRPQWLAAFYARNEALAPRGQAPQNAPPPSPSDAFARIVHEQALLHVDPLAAESALPLPMTRNERRRHQRQRADERSQQRALGRLAKNEKTKKAVSKVREEAPDIAAMCTTAEDNTCTICMHSHITTLLLPCRHALFCHGCITPWVQAHNNCPTCKTPVVTTVQMLTKFDPIEEHERRKRDPTNLERDTSVKKYRKERADALRKEADDLEAGRDDGGE